MSLISGTSERWSGRWRNWWGTKTSWRPSPIKHSGTNGKESGIVRSILVAEEDLTSQLRLGAMVANCISSDAIDREVRFSTLSSEGSLNQTIRQIPAPVAGSLCFRGDIQPASLTMEDTTLFGSSIMYCPQLCKEVWRMLDRSNRRNKPYQSQVKVNNQEIKL
jgi:hypothetical protein